MMSTANLTAVDIKQADAPSVSPGREEVTNISFAQSFDDGIKAASSNQSFVSEANAMVVSGLNAAKSLAETTDVPSTLKGKVIAGQNESAGGKSIAAENKTKIAGLTPAVTKAPEKTIPAEGLEKTDEAEGVVSGPEMEGASDDLSQAAIEEPKVEATGTNGFDVTAGAIPVSPVATVVSKEIAVSQAPVVVDRDTVVQKEKATHEKADEGVSAKKTEKIQQQLTPPGASVVQQTIGSAPSANEDAAHGAVGSMDQGALATGLDNGALRDVVDKTSNSRSEPGSMVSHAAAGGVASGHGVASYTKAATNEKFEVTEIASASASGQVASAKPGMEAEKPASFSTLVSADIDSKTPGMAGSSPEVTHATVTDTGAVAGLGATTTHIHVAGDVGTQKSASTSGDASPHGANVQPGVDDVNGFGEAAAPHMLVATPTTLEVGIQNGTHGWLRVRAEIADGGTVSASVSATSSAGEEMLHRELPTLAAYLQQEKVQVAAIVVQPSVQVESGHRGSTASMGEGQTQQGGNEGGQRQQNSGETASHRIGGTATYEGLDRDSDDGPQSVVVYPRAGNWLSVRA